MSPILQDVLHCAAGDAFGPAAVAIKYYGNMAWETFCLLPRRIISDILCHDQISKKFLFLCFRYRLDFLNIVVGQLLNVLFIVL